MGDARRLARRALAWHFAAMWLFALNGLAYVLYGLLARHFATDFLP